MPINFTYCLQKTLNKLRLKIGKIFKWREDMRAHQQLKNQTVALKWGEAACVCLLVVCQAAWSNPAGGQVTSGSATITQSGNTTTINQTSNKTIINWKDFSVGTHETTQFNQPSSSSVALNRVTGGNPSQILGSLKSNGMVYLINPNGILFGKNARVDVGGLVASTSQISDKSFLSGTQQFTPGGVAGASIVNEGHISVKNAGIAVLVSPTVINQGVITANLGTIHLASADHFTLDLYGDNLIHLDAGDQLSSGLIENAGTIQAHGGQVMITAQAAAGVLENVINMNGYIDASSATVQGGKVVLQGDGNTQLNVNGTINASGKTGGGTVQLSANDVNLNAGSLIYADAFNTGNGGTITLWSDHNTNAYGSLYARGGAVSGNGGFIETSSHGNVDTNGITVHANASHGKNGTWYIDPVTLTITDGLAAGYNTTLAGGTNVNISTTDGIEFANTTTNIAWNTGATFSVRSNSDANSITTDPSTITYNGGCTATVTCQVISNGAGNIDFFYNPTAYVTPTNFSNFVQTTGSGVFTAYMLVNNVTELNQIQTNLTGNYALNTDIAGIGAFTSIGGQGSGMNFSGIFTGAIQGTQYTLSDYTISGAGTDNVGLFGSVTGTVKNVSVSNANVTGDNNVGAIVGRAVGGTVDGTLTSSNGTVTGSAVGIGIGGIAGMLNTTATVGSNAVMTTSGGSVSGNTLVGGLIGWVDNSTWLATQEFVNNASVTGTGATASGIGGLVGQGAFNYSNNMTNHGTVFSLADSNQTGGVFGNYSGTATGVTSNNANVSGGSSVGGVFGETQGTSNVSFAQYSTGTVTGGTRVGGIAGAIAGTLDQSVVLSNATVSGTIDSVGGIVGQNSGTITNVSSAAKVSGNGASNVGGIAGENDGTIQYALNTGTVTGGSNVGALVGNNFGGAILENSLYNSQVNTGLSPTGVNTGTITSVIAGTSASLSNFNTYTNLGFSPLIWQISSGNYASLIWCGSGCYVTNTPIPDVTPKTRQIILTQINNAQTYLNSQSVVYTNALYTTSTGLNIIPATTIMDQMAITTDSPYYGAVTAFMDGTTYLQWLDNTSGNSTPTQVQNNTIGAIKDAVEAEQNARGCAI
jgi:filamentous hemagglutinin family protein